MSKLLYYFNNETSFFYNTIVPILTGTGIQITMPNNNSSLSVINITNKKGVPSYYTLNSISITMTSEYDNTPIGSSSYQLVLQGNLNDYNNNNVNQILIILPIYTNVAYTIAGENNAITNINNVYISNLFANVSLQGTYNFLDGMDLNQFFIGTDATPANIYTNVIDVNTPNVIYTIVQCPQTNIWTNESLPLNTALMSINIPSTSVPESITMKNNGKTIAVVSENDIYIDCKPTNNLGEPVDVYTSKDLDQLKMFKINDLKVWSFRFITIFIIILIVFVVIKIFQIKNDSPPSVTSPSPTP